MEVVVGLPDLGFYTTNIASQSNYITEFTVSDDGPNEFYLVSRNVTLNNVTLNDVFNDIAMVTLSDDKTYAKITINGTPNNQRYSVEAEVTNGNSTWFNGASLHLVNGKPFLQYYNSNWSNGVPSLAGSLRNSMQAVKGYNNNIYIYFTSNGTEQLVTADKLTSSNENIVKISANSASAELTTLECVDFGTATISYVHEGKTYSLDVTVGLPTIGFYSTPTARAVILQSLQ